MSLSSGEIQFADDISDADLRDLAELLSDNCVPPFEGNYISSSGSSTLISDLTQGSDSFEHIRAGDSNPIPASSASTSEHCQVVVKQNKTSQRFNKKQRKSVATKTTVRKGIWVDTLGAKEQKPNMSRRRPTAALVAFPAFDKCDSLLYFPTTLIRLFNAADLEAASKLMNKYVDKSCMVTFQGKNSTNIPLGSYKQLMAMGNDIEPDRIMCVHSTKVVENKIMSSIYVKFTDVQPLYANLARTSNIFEEESVLATGMFPDRARRFEYFATESSHNEKLAQELTAYAQREEDVLVYMRIDFTFTVDDMTRKILHFTHAYEITSVHIAGAEEASL